MSQYEDKTLPIEKGTDNYLFKHMRKLETLAISETIAVNRELCNYFLHLFNAEVPPMIPGKIQLSRQAVKYQELTTELIAFNIKLEIFKRELEALPE